MKNSFRTFYPPTQDEFSTMWDKGLFVFDTNVLLDLYRFTTNTSQKLLQILKQFSDRICVLLQ